MIKNEVGHVRITGQHCLEYDVIKINHGPTISIDPDYSGSTTQFRVAIANVTKTQPDFPDFPTFTVALGFALHHHAIGALKGPGRLSQHEQAEQKTLPG